MKKDMVIGVLGGMGTYATIHLFQQYAEVFTAEKEWDRPRIIIDNRCTMPSRVRAFLYNEKTGQLVAEMRESMERLRESGCNRIILACNTSHLFLEQVFVNSPELKGTIVNIIDACVDKIIETGISEAYLLGSEGTIESRIYQDALENRGVHCVCPEQREYSMLRDCIEAVKQNKFTDETRKTFTELINRNDNCILGCTELPILFDKYKEDVKCKHVFDPLLIVLKKLKEEYDGE